jgi:hypothetical protein
MAKQGRVESVGTKPEKEFSGTGIEGQKGTLKNEEKKP